MNPRAMRVARQSRTCYSCNYPLTNVNGDYTCLDCSQPYRGGQPYDPYAWVYGVVVLAIIIGIPLLAMWLVTR